MAWFLALIFALVHSADTAGGIATGMIAVPQAHVTASVPARSSNRLS